MDSLVPKGRQIVNSKHPGNKKLMMVWSYFVGDFFKEIWIVFGGKYVLKKNPTV
jgi:hypothetical protein